MPGYEEWAKRWRSEPRRATIGRKVRDLVNPPASMRSQLIQAEYRIATQIQKLDYNINKLQNYDKQLFEKTVNALLEGDKARARMYANEIAEIRKMIKLIMTVRYALERVKIRLHTAVVMGDTHAQLAPAVVALKQVAGYLRGMMPDVFTELVEVDETLQMALMQSAANIPEVLSTDYVSQEAENILREASLVAEQRFKQQLPELPDITAPSSLPGVQGTVEEGK